MAKKILFIANPVSGSINSRNLESAITTYTDSYKFEWEIYYTEKTDYPTKIMEIIDGYQPDIVVAVGGDGTVNQVATELIGKNTDLGIIPAGSANGLAYNLNIPTGFKEALHVILASDSKPVDAIELNGNYYCYHLSDIGINARIVKRFEKEGGRGLLGYGKQMIKELFSRRSFFSFTLETPEYNKRFSAEMLVIANARCFGTGAVINPQGKPDDGEFEIIVIKPYPWWILLNLFKMLFFGKLDNLKYVKIIKTTKALIKLDKPQDLQADGEIIRDIRTLNLKILPSALQVRYKNQ